MADSTRKTLEQRVLGGIMIIPDGFTQIHKILQSKMFEDKSHQEIFRAMAELYSARKPVKRLLIAQSLDDELGGVSTQALLSAMEVAALAEDSIPLEAYAEGMKDDYIRKEGAEFFKKISETIVKSTNRVDDVLDRAMAKLEQFTGVNDEIDLVSLFEALDMHTNKIEQRNKDGLDYGYDTGIDYINDLVGQFNPGEYIIVGAGTKTGKTAMTIDIALGLARYGPVLIFSPEMTHDSLAAREAAAHTGISTAKQRSRELSSYDRDSLSNVKNEINGVKNLYINSKKLTIDEIHKSARAFKLKNNALIAVVVDHLGILKAMKGGGRKDFEIAAEASPEMKVIAQDLGCVSIGLSQLNKDTIYGKTMLDKINYCKKPPSYHDLKGAIANDADHVIMPYRLEAVLTNIEPAKDTDDHLLWETEMEMCKGKGEVRLALSRSATWGRSIPLYWDGLRTKYSSMSQIDRTPNPDLF